LADTSHNPSKGEYIRPRWGGQRAEDCFDKMRVKKELVVCVLAGFVSFCFAAAFCLSGTRLLLARLRRDSDWSGGVENIALRFSERARPLRGGEPPVPADTIRCGITSKYFCDSFSGSVLWFAQIHLNIFSSELCIIEKQKYLHGHLSQPSAPLVLSSAWLGAHRG